MKATKENLKTGTWYKITRLQHGETTNNTFLKYQGNKLGIGYWRGNWDTVWAFSANGIWDIELATKEDLAKLGNEWEPYWEEENTEQEPKMREFDTGATRNVDDNKLDFEGFISPLALEEFAKYMHEHRMQADGKLRDSDNWQKGIPQDQYMKSMWRHFFDTWKNHRGHETPEDQIKNLCGLMFNVQGYLHELLKQK